MADSGAAAAQSYREKLRTKAERLGGGEDATNVDASDFSPAEKLYGGVKTGMRPVSRQARADGGAISGGHAAATPGRAGRKGGGGVGESIVNRDAKAADEDRAGHYPNGGMASGGRPRETTYDANSLTSKSQASRLEALNTPSRKLSRFSEALYSPRTKYGVESTNMKTGKTRSMLTSMADPPQGGDPGFRYNQRANAQRTADEANAPRSSGRKGRYHYSVTEHPGSLEPEEGFGHAKGGRTGRAEGGYISQASGPSETKALKGKTGSSAVKTDVQPASEQGRATGGRVARADGGPLSTPLAAGMGGQGRMNFNFAPNRATALKTGGRAHERYGHGPSCACSSCRSGKAGGGDVPDDEENQPMSGAAVSQGPRYNRDAVQKAISRDPRIKGKEAGRIHALLKGRQKGDFAEGGAVAEGALKQHKLEHKAIGKREKRAGGGPLALDEMLLGKIGGALGGGGGGAYAPGAPGKARGGGLRRRIKAPKPKVVDAQEGIKLADGGRATRASGGRSGKGKTNINIIIAPGGGGQQPPPGGLPPNLAIKPPPAAMPMPMPPPGGGPGAPAPAAMPMPMPPMGGGGPPMPPRARGGRAPKAGAGSGLGRLQKTAAYGERSREGEG